MAHISSAQVSSDGANGGWGVNEEEMEGEMAVSHTNRNNKEVNIYKKIDIYFSCAYMPGK